METRQMNDYSPVDGYVSLVTEFRNEWNAQYPDYTTYDTETVHSLVLAYIRKFVRERSGLLEDLHPFDEAATEFFNQLRESVEAPLHTASPLQKLISELPQHGIFRILRG